MMNRRIAAGVLIMLLVCGANEARAQSGGWRGWLDKLSGPGEFRGVEFAASIFCYGVPKGTGQEPPRIDDAGFQLKRTFDADIACRDKWDRAIAGATGRRVDLWKIAVGFEFGTSSSARNPLTYQGRTQQDGPKVTLGTIVSAVDFVPNAWLDVGAGAGFGWFTTAGFSTTWKPLIQPFRASVRPLRLLALNSRQRWPGVLQAKFNLTSFPGGFDAADFGAIPGSWQVGTELLKSFSIVLDFGELLRR